MPKGKGAQGAVDVSADTVLDVKEARGETKKATAEVKITTTVQLSEGIRDSLDRMVLERKLGGERGSNRSELIEEAVKEHFNI